MIKTDNNNNVVAKTFGFYVFRQYATDFKLETYLKIARLFLEDDDAVQAEAFINRASLLQNETKNKELQIHYKVVAILFLNSCYCLTCLNM